MMSFLLTNLETGAIGSLEAGDSDWASKGVYRHFWQPDFLSTYLWQGNYMSPLGYVFYPTQCYDGTTQCKLHIHLHGCFSSVRTAGEHYSWGFGFNDIAVANDLIVLYPDTPSSFFNLGGCWDSWGYTGGNYLTKDSI